MNRNEFLIVTSLSGLVAILLISQIVLARMTNAEQNRVMQAQQVINQGQVCLKNLQQVAMRTAQLSQQKDDKGLKDLMARQQISINPAPSQSSGNSAAEAPAPASVPAPVSVPTPTH